MIGLGSVGFPTSTWVKMSEQIGNHCLFVCLLDYVFYLFVCLSVCPSVGPECSHWHLFVWLLILCGCLLVWLSEPTSTRSTLNRWVLERWRHAPWSCLCWFAALTAFALVGWLVQLSGSVIQQTNKQSNKQTNKQRDKQTNKQTHRQTDRQTDRQTNKQANKQTNKLTN